MRGSQGSNVVIIMYEQTSCFDCKAALKQESLGPAVSQRQAGLAFRLAATQQSNTGSIGKVRAGAQSYLHWCKLELCHGITYYTRLHAVGWSLVQIDGIRRAGRMPPNPAVASGSALLWHCPQHGMVPFTVKIVHMEPLSA